ncbi:MAG: nickel pincer cofactor biosynthesis protein LarB [Deltaproteobacteria bacterium]|nr:nickel pincer cofactor biosynthesis protein LarB [Deltaproteobacteria bacterium]
MDETRLRTLIEQVAAGHVAVEQAVEALRGFPILDLGIAQLDTQRGLRNGFSEVVLCTGKTPDHVARIVRSCLEKSLPLLATRCPAELAASLLAESPPLQYDAVSRCLWYRPQPTPPLTARLAILAAGTADLAVAEEARVTARFFGCEAETYYDVGVAGLHRLLRHIETIRCADLVIVVAGMEGALASVVGGLVTAPIIAVPTSVGYGVHRGGETTLFAMLTSCAEGISVVNIDNGFGAACAALRILRKCSRSADVK